MHKHNWIGFQILFAVFIAIFGFAYFTPGGKSAALLFSPILIMPIGFAMSFRRYWGKEIVLTNDKVKLIERDRVIWMVHWQNLDKVVYSNWDLIFIDKEGSRQSFNLLYTHVKDRNILCSFFPRDLKIESEMITSKQGKQAAKVVVPKWGVVGNAFTMYHTYGRILVSNKKSYSSAKLRFGQRNRL